MTNKEKAILIAEAAHKNQKYDVFPYMYHLRRTAEIAEELGYDESIIVSCILHDTIEDTTLSYPDIKKYFDAEIAEIVFAVTDDVARNRKERKEKAFEKIKNNPKAIIVKLCDRIANVEHSKNYNPDKFKMYKKEYDEFIERLSNNGNFDKEAHKAYKVLKTLFGK